MDSLFGQWSTILIGIGSLVCSLWLWSGVRDWCLQLWKFYCHVARMNGPPALPIIGNAHYFAGSSDGILEKMTALSKLYVSPIRFWMGPRLLLGIMNPSEIEVVMNSSKATYKPGEYRFVEALFGRGLITSSGPTHKKHRNLIMPMVNGKALDAYIDSFDTQSRRCVECLESMVDQGEFDILPFLNMCTMDITFDTIFGAPATAQRNGQTELVEYIHWLDHLSHERAVKFWLHLDCLYYRTRRGKQHKEAETVVKKFKDDMIAEKKKEYYDSLNGALNPKATKTVLLEQMIAYNEENKLMDDARLIDEMFTVFIASQGPIANTSAFILLMLGMHLEIQDKVRAEVQEVVGNGNLTARTISELKYLDLVIKETLRLFPVASVLPRKVQKDLDFGTCIAPKGCTIMMFVFGVHRDPKFWEEPEKFNPDRFLPENSVGRHPYAYVPFSSGARGCIGQQYAKMAIKAMVTRVVQKYRLHSNKSLTNLELITAISVQSSDGYKVSLTKL